MGRYPEHGLCNSRIYRIWSQMKSRCNNPNSNRYKYYGGRGISVCDTWNADFMTFYHWAIRNGYDDDLTLDRIDNNGQYSPDNCRWITIEAQQNNRRDNYLITYNGMTKTLTQWSTELNINLYTLKDRLNKRNWSVEKAFTTPVAIKHSSRSNEKI